MQLNSGFSGSHEPITFSIILSVTFQKSVVLASNIKAVGLANASVVLPKLSAGLVVDVNGSNIVSAFTPLFYVAANFWRSLSLSNVGYQHCFTQQYTFGWELFYHSDEVSSFASFVCC